MTHHDTIDPRDPATILTELASALAHGDDVDVTLGRLLKAATGAVGAQVGVVYLQHPERTGLQVAVTIGLDEAVRSCGSAYPAGCCGAPGTRSRGA